MRSYLGHMFVAVAVIFVIAAVLCAVGYTVTLDHQEPQLALMIWMFAYLIGALVLGAIGTVLWVDRADRRAVRLMETLDQRPAPLIPKRSPGPQDEAHSLRKE